MTKEEAILDALTPPVLSIIGEEKFIDFVADNTDNNKADLEAAVFIFLLSFLAESKVATILEGVLREKMIKAHLKDVAFKDFLNTMLIEMDFRGKIRLLKQATGPKYLKFKDHIADLNKINNLRNDVSHNRIKELVFDNEPLTKSESKQILLNNLYGNIKKIYQEHLKNNL
jgi:hypothetical protein